MTARVGRPEHRAPPEVFYSEDEARKYTQNSRMIEIQTRMSERAVELLNLPEDQPCFLLDVGCGSGLSGDYLSEEGHHWVGVDISTAMLDVALEREVEGDLILGDVGAGIPFRAGTFDGCISISALQWLCNADKKSHSPPKRLYKFFSSLYASLVRGARAVFQFYPENSEQVGCYNIKIVELNTQHMVCICVFFLCLFVGVSGKLPMGLGAQQGEETTGQVQFTNARLRFKSLKGKPAKRSRDWILEKKERRRRQGRTVRNDTKYTGRKRKTHF
ncbi:hypothetical protein scyTo_0009154 [Scyliorhinus torazame]|uniref:18S rRNA (guanine-N(7))-methyltransferase n=1 Tax=Scyliorhinus torazame TaxID=75743 RepID=A0A401NHG7_SCYTO|nr:hypothetical protein [Scyliorhinus torazame]